MIKVHLDAAQLEKDFKADELRDLASQLGLDTSGKKEELAARIAAVEVEVEEEHKLTPEELKEIIAAVEDDAPAGAVNVICVKTYNDLQLKRLVKKGESYAVANKERADYLVSRRLVVLA